MNFVSDLYTPSICRQCKVLQCTYQEELYSILYTNSFIKGPKFTGFLYFNFVILKNKITLIEAVARWYFSDPKDLLYL